MHMDIDPNGGFRKLQHLLRNPPAPPETLGNLLLLHVKHQLYALAADVLADFTELHESCLSQDLYDYLDATIECHSSKQVPSFRFSSFCVWLCVGFYFVPLSLQALFCTLKTAEVHLVRHRLFSISI